MRRIIMAACIALALGVTSTAHATDANQFNVTIETIGLQSATNAYFRINETLTLNCSNLLMYMDLSTVFGRAAYSQLLAAKLTNSPLSHIYYTQPGASGTQCFLGLVELQD